MAADRPKRSTSDMESHNTSESCTVLVLGDHRQTITVVRSLGRAGHRVILGKSAGDHIACWSREIDEKWDHPPISDTDKWQAALAHFCHTRSDIGAIFPVGDAEIKALAKMRASLSVPIISAEPSIFNLCSNKDSIIDLAAAAGIPVERWALSSDPTEIGTIADSIGYPIILKPNQPGELSFKARSFGTASELFEFLAKTANPASGFIVQRCFIGKRYNAYFVAKEGRMLGYGEIEVQRTDRPDGTGLAVAGVTVRSSPKLLAYTNSLIASTRYTGVGCAQFLFDAGTGNTCFLELNARLGANCAAIYHAGLDLPKLFLEAIVGNPEPQPPVRAGRRYVWILGDIAGLINASREITTRELFSWFGQLLSGILRARDHVIWEWRDPLPGVVLASKLVYDSVARFFRSISGKALKMGYSN